MLKLKEFKQFELKSSRIISGGYYDTSHSSYGGDWYVNDGEKLYDDDYNLLGCLGGPNGNSYSNSYCSES